MGLFVGSDEAKDVYAGDTPALAVYRGADLVWQAPVYTPPASDLTNTCDGPEGTEVTVANSAGGGDPFQLVNNWTYEDTGMACPPVSQISIFQWDATGIALPAPATPDVQQSVGFWFRVDTLTSARIHDMRNSSNNVTYGGVELRPSGAVRALAGTTTIPESESPPLPVGGRFWITYGIDNSSSGSHTLIVQDPAGATIHQWTAALTGTGDPIAFRRFGKVTTSAAGLWVGGVAASSGTATGLPLVPP